MTIKEQAEKLIVREKLLTVTNPEYTDVRDALLEMLSMMSPKEITRLLGETLCTTILDMFAKPWI